MKKTKFLASIMAVAMALLLFPTNAVEASAEEPTRFVVKYVGEDWRFQTGSSEFNDSEYSRETYYLLQQIKDGDIVVVYNTSDANVPELDLGDKKLSNLTVVDADSLTVIYAGGVDEFYALADTIVSVNCDINTASVYDDVTFNVNGNVGTLNFYINEEINSVLGVNGTLGHFYGCNVGDNSTAYNYYNFQSGTFAFYNNGFQTPSEYYSVTPTTVTNPVGTAPTPTPAPAAPSTGNDYDDVPKTGESAYAFWLLLAAAVCGGASYFVKKKAL